MKRIFLYTIALLGSLVVIMLMWSRISIAQRVPAITTPPPPLPSPKVPQITGTAEANIFLPFYNRQTIDIKQTYYIAQNQPGADNANNGLFPVYQGGKNGPFKDMYAPTLAAIKNTAGIKVIVREGTYPIREPGIFMKGGNNENTPAILTGYPGEVAILDGKVETEIIVKMEGQYNILENIVVRNAAKYNVLVSGKYSIIRNCVFQGGMWDSLKVITGADHGLIFNNDISLQVNNGIDQFGADNWIHKNNNFHHGLAGYKDARARAMLTKGGTHNTVIVGNIIHDFESEDVKSASIMMGGSSGVRYHRRDAQGKLFPEATNAVAIGNTIYNVKGPAFHFAGCLNCIAEKNVIYNAHGGFWLALGQYDTPDEPVTENITIRENKLSNMTSGVIMLIEVGAEKGFLSTNNTYYTNASPMFVYKDQRLNHQEIQQQLHTDITSITESPTNFQP